MDEKILAEVKDDYNAFKKASPELQKDEAFVKKAILNNHVVLKLADTFRGNREFVKDIINTQPNALQFASEELKNDPELTGIQKAAFEKKWKSEAPSMATAIAEAEKDKADKEKADKDRKAHLRMFMSAKEKEQADEAEAKSRWANELNGYNYQGGRTRRRKTRRKTKLKRTRVVRKVKP